MCFSLASFARKLQNNKCYKDSLFWHISNHQPKNATILTTVGGDQIKTALIVK